jgi:hypothetical protein
VNTERKLKTLPELRNKYLFIYLFLNSNFITGNELVETFKGKTTFENNKHEFYTNQRGNGEELKRMTDGEN